ncbi:MAG TPA: DUF3180 family protein [Jatrophihabitans sp.]|jgi:hypothetical protein
MRRTGASDVLVPFVVVGALVYVLLRSAYESLPPFQWFVAIPVGALALAEFAIARRVRNVVRHRPDAKPMTALAVARAVALGKASSLVGAAVAGAATALVITVQPDASRTAAAGHDLWVGLATLAATAALTVAGIFVERAGIDPNR